MSLCGVMTVELNYDFEVSEFDFQSRHYIHFYTNIPEKSLHPLISKDMNRILLPLVFFTDDDWYFLK